MVRWAREEGEAHHEREAALGEMHHGRVEVGALVEGGRDHGGREGRGGLEREQCQFWRFPGCEASNTGAPTARDQFQGATHPCVPRQPHLHRLARENIRVE